MILAYKKKYQTCLQMLEGLRAANVELVNEKLSYNGILDPMAEGIVPVLVGDEENKNRDHYTGSIKEYEVEVLVGVSTDSGDLLGIVKNGIVINAAPTEQIVARFLQSPCEFQQTVPMHSNRKVRGKRLWWWILNGIEIPEDERPKNNVRIIEMEYLGESYILRTDLEKEIDGMELKIGARFRLAEVVKSWREYFLSLKNIDGYRVLKFRLKVSSGFYVRTFVESVSRELSIPMVVMTLKRSQIEFLKGGEV